MIGVSLLLLLLRVRGSVSGFGLCMIRVSIGSVGLGSLIAND